MLEKSDHCVMFLALARDCGRTIGNLFTFLRRCDEVGLNWRLLVGENDSKDNTRQILTEASRDPRVRIVSTNAMSIVSDRLVRMAVGRNVLLNEARSFASEITHVAVIDVDEVLNPNFSVLAIKKYLSILDGDLSLIAISSTSAPYYYDLLALRMDGVKTDDIADRLDDLRSKYLSYYRYHRDYIYSVQKKMTSFDVTYVESAFNGLCIYRSDDFFGGDYLKGRIGNECEHVTFNRSIRSSAQSIMISKDLIARMPKTHGPANIVSFFVRRAFKTVGLMK
jgi:hypothetical protein